MAQRKGSFSYISTGVTMATLNTTACSLVMGLRLGAGAQQSRMTVNPELSMFNAAMWGFAYVVLSHGVTP